MKLTKLTSFISVMFIITFSFTCLSQTIPSVEISDINNNPNNILVDCDYPIDADRCFVLQANYTELNETTSYVVNSIPYTTLSGLTNATEITSYSSDDQWSDIRAIPFDFCFYNNIYNELLVGDNGIISFNTLLAGDATQYSPNVIPNNVLTNVICGVYHDLTIDPGTTGCQGLPLGTCGAIKTYTFGTAPFRGFVISYENIVHVNDATSRSTSQIVLYETSNIIEVYVHEKPINNEPPSPLNDLRKNALIGIQNIDGSSGTAAPGRNSATWTATDEAWQFLPNGNSTTTVQWLDENGIAISSADQITICPEASTNYTVNIIYDLCIGGNVTITDTIDVTISFDYPVAIDNEQIVCDLDIIGEEIVDLTSYETLMIGTQTGLLLTYYHSLADANTATNPIIAPDVYLLQNPTEVIYVRLQRSLTCFDVGTLALNLDELAISQLNTISVCDVINDNSELLTLTNYTNTILGVQTGVTVSYYTNQADADATTNPITDITAANGDSVFVRLTLQPDDTCPNIIEIPIELYTVPEVAPIPVELCSDIAIYDLTQTEAVTNSNNTVALNYAYFINEISALNNTNPFDPTDPTNPIDPTAYQLNSVLQLWVRTWTTNGCIEVYPINFSYINGIPAGSDQQVSLGSVFDLSGSILDMVPGLIDNLDGTYTLGTDIITIQYYDTQDGAANQDPTHIIADPLNYTITNPDGEVFVVFTNTASGCSSIGNIELSAVGFGGNGGNITLLICDYDTPNTEEVILSDYDNQVVFGYDDAQYMEVTYYQSSAEANANLNPITTFTLTTSTTIWVRISLMFQNPGDAVPQELDFIVDSIVLDFQAISSLSPVTDTICDEFGNGNEPNYDITQYESQISTDAGVSFDYQYTNGISIPTPNDFTIQGPTQVIDVLVTTVDGCITQTTITINFFPLIDTTATTIYACDLDNNNEEIFNLNDVFPNLNVDFASYDISYYPTELEAQTGDLTTTIATNYTVNTSPEIVYVRLYDPITMCYSTEQITLEIVPVPAIAISNFDYCDFENDGIENMVDLTQYTASIIGLQQNVSVSYHALQNDADNNINPITTVNINNSVTTIYVRLSAPGSCNLTETITISLTNAPVVSNTNVVVCDNNPTGEEIYDLTQSNSTIIADTANHNFQYYLTLQNALDNISGISNIYNITNVPQTIYVRVTNLNTSCFSIAKIHLTFTFPIPVQDTELSQCDDDFNLAGIFDLSNAIPAMLADTTDLDLTYYTTLVSAENADNTFLITDPTIYDTSIPSNNEVAYVRFYDAVKGCFTVGKIDLNIFKVPKLRVGEYEVCDIDFDGNYVVDLAEVNNIITIVNDPGNVYTYYTNNADAENENNPISNTTNYAIPLPVSNYTIYVRVINQFGCWAVAPLTFQIKDSVTIETITDTLYACDDDNNGFSFFDLTAFSVTHPFSLEANISYKYYNSLMEANLEQNQISTPSIHENTTVTSQIIYVRVSAPDKCDSITSFTIAVQHITPPIINNRYFCAGSSSTISIDNVGEYTDFLWSTTATTQTIEVNVAGNYSVTLTDGNGCIGTFDIIINEEPLPNVFPTQIIACDYDGTVDNLTTFDLTNYTDQLTGNNANVTTHFFLNQADLDADTNEQTTNFTSTTNPQTLLVKIIDNTTLCFDTTTLILRADSIVLTPNTYEICDTNLDGNYTFNLTELNNLIVADTTALNFEYYTSQADADVQNNPITTTANYTIPTNNHLVFIRVENANNCAYVSNVEVSYKPNTQVNVVNDVMQSCDDNLDEFAIFDLTAFEAFVTNETNPSFAYYNNESDAKSQTNQIPNENAHQNITATTQTVFVRVSTLNQCDAITSFVIEVRHIIPPTLTTAEFCAGDTVNLDMTNDYLFFTWNTNESSQSIDVNQAGTYSVTLTDANGCIGTFDVVVTELPLPNVFPTQIIECDYDGTVDNLTTFELTNYIDQLTGNNTNVTTHFFLTQADLDADTNEQITNFTTTTNPQILLVKIVDNNTLCFNITTLTLEASSIASDSAMLELCDELDSLDGINTFDLSIATPQVIINLPAGTQVKYYETYIDAQNNTNTLGNYYTNTFAYSQTLYSRVVNSNGCIGISEVYLIINDLPELLDNEQVYYCLNTFPDTITLDSGLVNGTLNNYNFSWSTNENTPTIEINTVGDYNVIVTSAIDGCSRSRTITVLGSSIAEIESIEISDPVNVNQVTIYVIGQGDYEYAIDDIDGEYQDSTIFYNITPGFHTAYVRDKNGCGIVTADFTSIQIPKFFTPNHDSHYDTWLPVGLSRDLHSDIVLHVFNRFGKPLAKLDPFGQGWNGRYLNKDMQQNDYWYRLEYTETFSGERRLMQGHFTLKRYK